MRGIEMSNYLDTDKSIIISAPAGSGKTEKLARRYIALLQKSVDVERILAITFTDKAAAEMKQRILKILREEDEKLFVKLLDKMPLIRVSTIHSFCGTLLRRFSFEAGIDPNYKVEDAIDSRIVWEDILFEILMDAGRGKRGHDLFIQTLSEKGFRGLDYLRGTADYLYQKTPFSIEAETFQDSPAKAGDLIEELRRWPGVEEAFSGYIRLFEEGASEDMAPFEKLFLTDRKEPRKRAVPLLKNIPDYRGWAEKMYIYWKEKKIEEFVERTERIKDIFRICLEKYIARKKSKGILDFSDLEYLAYRMVTENPEWANILYAFDEKTDHLLVDEFQDTNNFQWAIVDKLTEEWRSGLGSKRTEGIRPTVFFVGDEKQSIYFFRGANVEIFRRAREKLEAWLGDEFCYEEVKENYRSLPAIIEFTNHVFSRLMDRAGGSFPWVTEYTPFYPYRKGVPDAGSVELIMLNDEAYTVSGKKEKEAEVLAQRILGLVGSRKVTDRTLQQQKPCRYMDMAILLRKRTHLKKYEEALSRHNIPFVAVKGIGFYQEPEVAMLRALVFFLSNRMDDYSLYVLLKGPLFHVDEGTVIRLIHDNGESLYTGLVNGEDETLQKIAGLINEWFLRLSDMPVSELIEYALIGTGAWKYFHEAQRRANIKKFIRIVEELEASGKSLLKIRDFLERTDDKSDEPKANVNTEGMDAVRIMTVHASKGLEFPIVFVPGIDEQFLLRTDDRLVYEKEGKFFFKSLPEASIRRQDEDFLAHLAKEAEEQKRLFYVAATRAEEALVMLSHWSDRENSFLDFLKKGINIEKEGEAYTYDQDIRGFSLLNEDDVKMLFEHAPRVKTRKIVRPPVSAVPITFEKQAPWRSVTETVDIRRQHGKEWAMLGDIIHRIFEGVSKGTIVEGDISKKAGLMLRTAGDRNAVRGLIH
jgi:ATP-dependent helicase/nuclease subunit A